MKLRGTESKLNIGAKLQTFCYWMTTKSFLNSSCLTAIPHPQTWTFKKHGRQTKTKNKLAGFYGPIAPQVWMPAERRAQFRVPNAPRSRFPNALHSEFMNTPNVEFFNVPVCSAPMSYLAGSKWGRPLCYGHAAQNRSTLMGSSAGQRHTDRQTNSAENKGPSGLLSSQ